MSCNIYNFYNYNNVNHNQQIIVNSPGVVKRKSMKIHCNISHFIWQDNLFQFFWVHFTLTSLCKWCSLGQLYPFFSCPSYIKQQKLNCNCSCHFHWMFFFVCPSLHNNLTNMSHLATKHIKLSDAQLTHVRHQKQQKNSRIHFSKKGKHAHLLFKWSQIVSFESTEISSGDTFWVFFKFL